MTLVIMAAGMGNRYGGLKQIDPIGNFGEFILDYSIYDAINAGFDKVVFIIKEENLQVFKETVGNRIAAVVSVEYAFQRTNDVPSELAHLIPAERTKPWGTAQAVLACADIVNEPFAVINADDFYGRESFELLSDFLKNDAHTPKPNKNYSFCMVGFVLDNTLTDNGHVARGVCELNSDNYLTRVTERTQIETVDGQVKYFENGVYTDLDRKSTVSMNCWGFTPELFTAIKDGFKGFFEQNKDNLLKAEYFLPFVVDDLLKAKKCDVKVLNTAAKWYGVTYHEDKQKIMDYVRGLISDGIYPDKLWKSV